MTGIVRPVLAGVDGSPDSVGAARWAAAEAVRLHQPLQIIHINRIPGVYDRAPADDELSDRVAVEARRWQPGLHVTTCTLRGDPVELLLQQTPHASLIAVGACGAGGSWSLAAGPVGERLAARAHCPVLVVRGGARWAGEAPLPADRPILVGTAGPGGAELAWAFAEAADRGVGVLAVRAWPSPHRGAAGAHSHAAAEVARALHADLEPWRARYGTVPAEARTEAGAASEALLGAAPRALMVVLGAGRHAGAGAVPPGNVTHELLHHSPVPVLVARH